MAKGRILVVDDNESNIKLFVFLLSASGYDVATAGDARAAEAVLEGYRPDLLLLDLQLPDMDGLEFTRRLRARPETAHLPIVAVTAYAMKGDQEKALAAGVDGYITKPIDKTAFRAVVSQFFEGRSS